DYQARRDGLKDAYRLAKRGCRYCDSKYRSRRKHRHRLYRAYPLYPCKEEQESASKARSRQGYYDEPQLRVYLPERAPPASSGSDSEKHEPACKRLYHGHLGGTDVRK